MLHSNREENQCVKIRKRIKGCVLKVFTIKTAKKRLPILQWLPKYNCAYFIQDFVAGITVGLTAIPQGIAYAVVAGLSPEYGLYASLMSGFVYVVFGSCKDVTVGPTAILAAMVARYVDDYSADFAILAAFLSGAIQFILGIFHLGFLVDFISQPVISGFTTAAALQIAAAQLKSFFGTKGSSGNYFAESVNNFVSNIKTAKLWEPVLATATIIMLILLKKLGEKCSRTDSWLRSMRWFISLARNAVVVIIGMIIAYILKVMTESEPLALIGDIGKGLPPIKLPPFETTVGNETLSFNDMLSILGPQSLIIPFVGILESIAIAKTFAGGNPIDATQELIALGLCNMIGSFAASMPITGSFTRTAINHASGVQTPAGGISKCLLLIVAVSVMASTFYYIPKASLAGLILVAMYHMIDLGIFVRLWRSSIKEFCSLSVTMLVCLFYGLEYGIIVGILFDALWLLYTASKPSITVNVETNAAGDVKTVSLYGNLSYCAAEHVRRAIMRTFRRTNLETIIILDGSNLRHIDSTVAANILTVVSEKNNMVKQVVFLNFNSDCKTMFLTIDSNIEDKFLLTSNIPELVQTLQDSIFLSPDKIYSTG